VSTDAAIGKRRSWWVPVAGLVIALVLIGAGIRLAIWLNDPLRTLTPFPVEAYFANPQGLLGSRFRAEMTVDADLGWKEGVGKLMAFHIKEGSKPFAVLIPESLSGTYFEKGQIYRAEVAVKDGGLVVLRSCQRE